MQKNTMGLGLVTLLISIWGPPAAWGAAPLKVPLSAPGWEVTGEVEFSSMEGFPQGLLSIKSAAAKVLLKQAAFGDGTIEYDVKAIGDGIPGLKFHRRDDDTAEQFYIRPNSDCPASNDCIQYTPQTHGNMLWDAYPQYQSKAPVRDKDWNHVKLVMSGRRMLVYINDAVAPTLTVGNLEGDVAQGGLQLMGPATFANLTLAPGAVEGLPPEPLADPADRHPGIVRHWLVTPPRPYAAGGAAPGPAADPGLTWKKLDAEHGGLLNLSREYGRPLNKATAVVHLKTVVEAETAQDKQVALGWARDVWVYLNGKLVFSDQNHYYPEAERRFPDGRLALDNGAFRLPLKQGRNEIEIVVGNVFRDKGSAYGWGAMMRLDDVRAVRLAGEPEIARLDAALREPGRP